RDRQEAVKGASKGEWIATRTTAGCGAGDPKTCPTLTLLRENDFRFRAAEADFDKRAADQTQGRVFELLLVGFELRRNIHGALAEHERDLILAHRKLIVAGFQLRAVHDGRLRDG